MVIRFSNDEIDGLHSLREEQKKATKTLVPFSGNKSLRGLHILCNGGSVMDPVRYVYVTPVSPFGVEGTLITSVTNIADKYPDAID